MPRSERRHDPRLKLEKPIKIRCDHTGKYYSGRSLDLSAGGALVEVHHPSLMVTGQPVSLGIADSPARPMLAADHMIRATIARTLGTGSSQYVAVQFEQRRPQLTASA